MNPVETGRSRWRMVVELLNRPYPLRPRVLVPMITLLALVPGYLVIAGLTAGRPLHVPELALDRLIPLEPAWALVYGSHLAFVFMPVLIMRKEELIRRAFLAWLFVWISGYACFLVWPTVASRPADAEIGRGFFAWALRIVYEADPPLNCFPSLHVAHAFVSALICRRVHRGVGLAAGVWAALIALSTLFTKQHYVADVLAGMLLAVAADIVFLRGTPPVVTPELDRRAAPLLMLGLIGIHGLVVAGFWVGYMLR